MRGAQKRRHLQNALPIGTATKTWNERRLCLLTVYRSTNKFHDSSRMCDRKLVGAPLLRLREEFPFTSWIQNSTSTLLNIMLISNYLLLNLFFMAHLLFGKRFVQSPPPSSCLRPINKYRFLLVDFCDTVAGARLVSLTVPLLVWHPAAAFELREHVVGWVGLTSVVARFMLHSWHETTKKHKVGSKETESKHFMTWKKTYQDLIKYIYPLKYMTIS